MCCRGRLSTGALLNIFSEVHCTQAAGISSQEETVQLFLCPASVQQPLTMPAIKLVFASLTLIWCECMLTRFAYPRQFVLRPVAELMIQWVENMDQS